MLFSFFQLIFSWFFPNLVGSIYKAFTKSSSYQIQDLCFYPLSKVLFDLVTVMFYFIFSSGFSFKKDYREIKEWKCAARGLSYNQIFQSSLIDYFMVITNGAMGEKKE